MRLERQAGWKSRLFLIVVAVFISGRMAIFMVWCLIAYMPYIWGTYRKPGIK
jgi:hypothetical protein